MNIYHQTLQGLRLVRVERSGLNIGQSWYSNQDVLVLFLGIDRHFYHLIILVIKRFNGSDPPRASLSPMIGAIATCLDQPKFAANTIGIYPFI